MSGYDVEKLEAMLARATELYEEIANDRSLSLAAVNALPAMLHDLKLLAAARESGVIREAAKRIEEEGRAASDEESKRFFREQANLLRTLAAPPTEEDDGWTGER